MLPRAHTACNEKQKNNWFYSQNSTSLTYGLELGDNLFLLLGPGQRTEGECILVACYVYTLKLII